MGNMEFRYKRSGQYLGVVFLIPFIIFLLSMFFPLIDIRGWADRISVGDYPSIWGVIGFLVLTSIVLLEIWLFVGMFTFSPSYKITITDTDLVITGWDFWGRKLLNQMNHGYYLGKIPYESINSIDLDAWKPGVLKLTFHDGSYIFIPSRALENHTEFIELLSEKLVNAQGLEALAQVNEPKRFKHLQTFIYSLAFAPTIVLMFLLLANEYEPKVWNEELTPWGVRALSRDSDGTLWASTSNRDDGLYIWRFFDNTKEHWTLPKEICGECDSFTVSHDSHDFPIVISNEKDPNDKSKRFSGIYKWDGNSWEMETVNAFFFSSHQNSMDTRVWAIKDENLIYIDFATDEVKEITPPAEALSQDLKLQDFRINWDGSLLAEFKEKDKPTIFYKLVNDKWGQPIEISSPIQHAWKFYLDFNGNFWALTTSSDDKKSLIGLYDVSKNMWKWHEVEFPQSDRELAYFNDLAVDAQGRIWIYGVYNRRHQKDYFLDFVLVLDWSENEVKPIIEYTEKNSNLDGADFFIVENDRIWLGRFNLLWIDTTEELPAPAPEWVVWMKEFEDENFGWYFPICIGQFILALIGASLEYK